MIKLVIKNGVQTITEVCDNCKCHVTDLNIDDILVKGKSDIIIKDTKGNIVTREKHEHQTCECEHCKHD
tara:strand:+ start:2196 stop:2402 length:207 start_codon:yes stop_codon:yes gene_type:complete